MTPEQFKTLIWLVPLVYLAGSLNFSILLFKLLGKGDPRGRFSGNPGTFNVTRQAGYLWGAVVLVLDVGRAALIAILAEHLLMDGAVSWTGLALLLGNCYPLFHGFKGGKGVASYLGFTAGITSVFAFLSCIIWVLVYALVRVPFIASFFMIGILSIGIMRHYHWSDTALLGTILTLSLILYAHRSNVRDYLAARKGLTKKG